MIGCDSSGSITACKVFITSRDVVRSLDYTCMQSYTINKRSNNNKKKAKITNKKKETQSLSLV